MKKQLILFVVLTALMTSASAQQFTFTVEGEELHEGNLTIYRYHALSPTMLPDTLQLSDSYRELMTDIVEKHRCRLQQKLDTRQTPRQRDVDSLCVQQGIELQDELEDMSFLCEDGSNERLTTFFSQRTKRELSRTQGKANTMPQNEYYLLSGIGFTLGVNESFLPKDFYAGPQTSLDFGGCIRLYKTYLYSNVKFGTGMSRQTANGESIWSPNKRLYYMDYTVNCGLDLINNEHWRVIPYVGLGLRCIGGDNDNVIHRTTQLGILGEYKFRRQASLRPGLHIDDKLLYEKSAYFKLEYLTDRRTYEYNSLNLGIGINFDLSNMFSK